MSVSALVRFLIATFEWLETVGLPALRSAVHWLRKCCANLRQKFYKRQLGYLAWASIFRLQIFVPKWLKARPRLRNWIYSMISGFLSWLGQVCFDALILAGSAAAFALFWLWAWTP